MSKKHLAISLLALVLASGSSLYGDILDTRVFSKRITVTFTGVQSGVTLADFPALVKLSTAIEGFSYDDFKGTNGADLRFADSAGNLIPHEIDTWNPSGVSTVWVKVPSLAQGAVVSAYYGSTATLPEVAAKDVWDENYVGVWHLGESALPMKESSETSSDFTTANNGGAVEYAAEGIVGGSVNFGTSGRGGMLNAPDHDALDGFTACTIEAWTFMDAEARSYKAGGSDVSKGLLSKRSNYQVEGSYHLWDVGTGLSVCIASNGTSQTSITGIADVPSGVWVHQVVTFNAGNVANYKSGAPSGTDTTPVKKINAGAADLHLGNFNSGDARNFPGKVDEVRISKIARSAAWLKATYDTISSADFATYAVGSVSAYGQIDASAFSKKVDVTFSGYTGAELTNFPVLVKLSTAIDGFRYADFKVANGGDLRFADAYGNLIPYEIDTWNPDGVSTVWVRMPVLAQNATVTAYYGSSATLPDVPSRDVWDDGYVGVWHLGESALPMKESTGVSTPFSAKTGTVAYGAEGVVGKSADFSTVSGNNYLKANDDDDLDGFTDFTIELWAVQNAFRTDNNYGGMLTKRNGANSQESILIYEEKNGVPTFCFNSDSTSGHRHTVGAKAVPVLGEWTHYAFTLNSSSSRCGVFFNGTNNVNSTTTLSSVFAGTATLNIGGDPSQQSFPGRIDEVRISRVARSEAWIKATHDTVTASGFATYEAGSAPGALMIDENDFAKQMEITFHGYAGAELENFPVLVRLSTDIAGFKYADFALQNGGDLRFADSTGVILPHEIDTWDESGVSTVWVKVPSLAFLSKIKAYYGCINPPHVDPKDVWDSNYVGVWHLGESALPMKESTGVGSDFSSKTGTVNYAVSGVVGRSVDFSSSYATKTNALFADDDDELDGFEDFTLEVWTCQNAFYTDTSKELYAGILGKRAAAKSDESFFVYQNSLKSAGNTFPKACFNVDGTEAGREMLTAVSLPRLGQWMHSAYTRNASTGAFDIFFDGTNNVSASTTHQGPVHASSAPLQLGWVATTYNTFPGKIDEVRISRSARSAAWIKATHDTIALADFAYYEVLSYQPDDTQWYTNGVIACSTPDYTRESGDSYVYVFTTNCVVMALTNLHLTAISQSSVSETDYGYFQPGETKEIVASAGTMLGLTAEPVDLDSISSAEVTPAGGYTETREGAYTVYTFTGSGSIAVDKPGVADVVIVGPGGGETVTLRRLILNEGTSVVISETIAGIGRYMVGAGTEGGDAGYVIVRVWDDYVLSANSIGPSKATFEWGVTAISGTANIRLRYGTSKTALTNTVMLAAGASAGAGGLADVTGLDPDTTYYAQLQVDGGSGYASVGEVVSFATAALLPRSTGGKEVFVGEPVTPGLKAGFANTNYIDIATTDSKFRWRDNLELGIIAATNATSGLSDTGCPPIWANNRVWVFSGCMYFDGEHYYQFGEAIDDAVKVYIDGSQLFSDAGWNSWGSGCKKPTEGWHSVEFRFSNGTGGAGISGNWKAGTVQRTDKNGLDCGFGWGKSTTNAKPANMSTLEWLCDPGDGSLLRPEMPKEFFLSINGFEVDDTQYNVTISNSTKTACSGIIYYGEGTDVDSITNSPMQLRRRLDIDAFGTVTLELDWEGDQPPNYVVVIPDVGSSEVMSFTASSLVAASVKSVGSDSAVVTVALGFDLEVDGDVPTSTLAAYFGPTDAGAGESGWAHSQALGSVEAGTYDFTVNGLQVGESYVLRIKATDAGGNAVWSAPVSFSVSGVYLGGSVEVYENDPRQQKVALNRAGADLSGSMTVFLEYSGSGTGSVSALPGSLTFGPGESVAYITFTVSDNSRKDGNRSFDVSIMEGSSYVAIAPLAATVTILDDESADGEVVTWTGANGNDWADGGNWDKGHAPRSVDTACFADTGVSADMTVNVASAEGIRQLVIETPLAFTLSGTGSLAVNRVVRTDTDNVEEGKITMALPVVVGNWEGGFSRWTVEGSAGIELGAGLSAPEGVKFLKEGSGSLWLSAANTTYSGPWKIYEGAVYASAVSAVKGDISLGGSSIPARLEALVDNAISPASSPSVYGNGTLVAKESADASIQPMRVNVHEGGVANLGDSFSGHQVYLTGGTVNGNIVCYGASDQRIESYASSETATLGGYCVGAAANDLSVKVEDGEAPVDLVLGGRIYYGEDAISGGYLTKKGSGTVRTTADWTGMSLGVEIAEGRVLVDNPSADGLGNQAVKVDAGATLGGTGFIGGTTASYATSSAVTVEGKGNNEGTIAPGTLDAAGNHVIGTLTVGSPSKGGSVSFGDYTRFTVHIGPNGTCDRLLVNGTVSIAAGAGTKIEIVCDTPAAVGGKYRVLKATGGVTGAFFNVTAPLPGWKVTYTADEIFVEAPQPGRRLIIR